MTQLTTKIQRTTGSIPAMGVSVDLSIFKHHAAALAAASKPLWRVVVAPVQQYEVDHVDI